MDRASAFIARDVSLRKSYCGECNVNHGVQRKCDVRGFVYILSGLALETVPLKSGANRESYQLAPRQSHDGGPLCRLKKELSRDLRGIHKSEVSDIILVSYNDSYLASTV